MARIVLDSSAVVALLNELDASHAQALQVRDSALGLDDEQLLPYEVLAETLNVVGRKLGRSYAVVAANTLLGMHQDAVIRLIEPAPRLIKRAVATNSDRLTFLRRLPGHGLC